MPRVPERLQKKQSVLVIVDMQEGFRPVIHAMEDVIRNCGRLIRFCDRLDIPITVTEQYPAGLGRTVPELKELIPNIEPFAKTAFSCAADPRLMGRLQTLERPQVILCGIEAHVCVYQTAFDLRALDWQVAIPADAVSSRLPENRELALARLRELGVQVMSAEMIMFEILHDAATDDFAKVAKILKG